MVGSQSIEDWCKAHGFSRAFYYKLKAQGLAPRELRVGRAVRISFEADREWVQAREAAAAAAARPSSSEAA
ncbi:transcriptional regulator [Rhodoplanes sp. SY1]|uniref:transcriptional regulator n=1 Tax=Rhodoplanes sp. SY1 TaxID=3166646 RepID=UPI0038B64885